VTPMSYYGRQIKRRNRGGESLDGDSQIDLLRQLYPDFFALDRRVLRESMHERRRGRRQQSRRGTLAIRKVKQDITGESVGGL